MEIHCVHPLFTNQVLHLSIRLSMAPSAPLTHSCEVFCPCNLLLLRFAVDPNTILLLRTLRLNTQGLVVTATPSTLSETLKFVFRVLSLLSSFQSFRKAMAQIWCALKPGGVVLLGVPIRTGGPPWVGCGIAWNAHRYYGRDRFKHVLANFEVIDAVCAEDSQPIIIAKKVE